MVEYAVGKAQATAPSLVDVSVTQVMIIVKAHVQLVVIYLGLLLIALDLQQQ
jgi:hypothetical protein